MTAVAFGVLDTSVGLIAEDLRRYGEDDVALWVMTCSDDELLRVCSVADWLLLRGQATTSGSSMMIAKACAVAAVYVCEGKPRNLRRRRRMPASAGTAPDEHSPDADRRPDLMAQLSTGRDYGVGQDARDFWSAPK
ncbi:hypothetical protein [Amycolatopsis sp. NPDC051371]|uniref:hypothetical protein n=1 Tax=Amycolatopsis sp. NPDC051371 TaxID=3155800 RepID=UPI0034476957